MENNENNIHNIDVTVICDFFIRNRRQGPGSNESTKCAFQFLPKYDCNALFLDLGSGTGSQTFALAESTEAKIVAIDLFKPFIDVLNARAKQKCVSEKVKGIVGSMDNLPFEKESIDVIWCEGAIYNIGFQYGINYWRSFLKSDGYIAISESVWLTNSRPSEICDFWNECYPEIDTIHAKIRQLQDAGYKVIASFILPENCWTENYYVPMDGIKQAFLADNSGNDFAENFIAHITHEAELYDNYHDYYYGYAFFIAQKVCDMDK